MTYETGTTGTKLQKTPFAQSTLVTSFSLSLMVVKNNTSTRVDGYQIGERREGASEKLKDATGTWDAIAQT